MAISQTIFLSSTYSDLVDYRQKAIDVITSLKQHYEGMEIFGADERTPLEVMLDKLSYCQIYVGIIGMRYGSVDKATNKSYTQLEYERAMELKIPCLIYIIDEERARIAPKDVEKGAAAELLDAFKNQLRSSHIVKQFDSVETLGGALLHDIPQVIDRLKAEEDSKKKDQPGKNSKNVNLVADYKNIEKALLRPVKYHGKEFTLKLQVIDSLNGWRLKSRIVRAFGLSEGDASSLNVMIVPPKGVNSVVNEATRNVNLYVSGEMAEWLIENRCEMGAILEARVRFCCASLTGVTEDDTEEIIVGLRLIEGVSVLYKF